MRIPKTLTGEAADYWRRNAPWLIQNDLLNESSRDAFMLLCQLWGKLADNPQLDAIKQVALSKQIQNLQKVFGLDPLSRKRLKLKVDEKKEEPSDLKKFLMSLNEPDDTEPE
ncbi:MAG: hypothetical protein U0871_04095 [Gemmataceae bacterium]